MRESQQVLEWQAEALKEGRQGGLRKGRTEGRTDTLLDVMRFRFGSAIPDDLIAQVKG